MRSRARGGPDALVTTFAEAVMIPYVGLGLAGGGLVVVLLGTVLFALWPAMRVARMKPLDGIRQARLGG